MSGHMFRSAEQEHHAFRCFTSALYLYRDSKWEELHNHLRSALAAQLYSMERMAVALQLYAKLVGSTGGGRVSSKSQQKFISHLLEICNEHPKKALVGADRMAASPSLSGEKRDAVRKQRLDRIVQVIRYTKSASRVLELPNMDLPRIEDSTVNVIADELFHLVHEDTTLFGNPMRGDDAVWEELILTATAELQASTTAKAATVDEVTSSALQKIADLNLRKYIAQIDKERISANLSERSKKSPSYVESPAVRAMMEPITLEFAISNPLSIPIDLVDLQIVARMLDESGKTCTNEDAIKITPLVSYNEKESWTFKGSDVKYWIPDFCRTSTDAGDQPKQSWKSVEDVAPFFVITKQNLTLEAGCRRFISASICPVVQGNLEILGVRCRLFDAVWVFHPFDLKGDLLQNKRSNRSKRIRSKSLLLMAKVERGMPCLTAELVSTTCEKDNVALDGRTRQWTLRLANVGTAPATNVTLKTNLPWVSILEHVEHDAVEEIGPDSDKVTGPANFCIGPTGTLMRIPLQATMLQNKGQICPGESVDVSIRIRTAGSGAKAFYMLFRYELYDLDTTGSRCRWLRKMFNVHVYPSLSLSASIKPSFANQGEHILSVEISNLRSERTDKLGVILKKLSLAGRCYDLDALGFSGSEEITELGWLERTTMHFRLVGSDSSSKYCRLSECPLSPSGPSIQKNVTSSHLLNFLCLERAHYSFEKTMKAHQMALVRAEAAQEDSGHHPRSITSIRRANTRVGHLGDEEVAESHPTSITRLLPLHSAEHSFHLICSWTDEENKMEGEHFIKDVDVRPPHKANKCPITITACHPESITNDFSKGPVTISFEVSLRNCLTNEALEFDFSVDDPGTFEIIGPECFSTHLAGCEDMSVPMRAVISSSGVYNLQRIRLTLRNDDKSSYVFSMQWLISVQDKNYIPAYLYF
jgi:hypothetical protein